MTLNGMLMSQDIEVAEIVNDSIIILNEKLIPYFLKRTGNFQKWLESRAIDRRRTNARLLKKVLRLTAYDDSALVLKVHAAAINDSYWFRSDDKKELTYQDVRFKDNSFDTLALYGNPDAFGLEYSPTPELTNTGSYEKCWRFLDGHWWLYKQGTELERFSEMFVYQLGRKLGFFMAKYELDGSFIRSLDFTNSASVNYESAEGLVGNNEDYIVNFDVFSGISQRIARQYLDLIYMDALCCNGDRHTKNYGILRDVKTGSVLSLAPNFDNNNTLLSKGHFTNSNQNDFLIKSFVNLLQERPKAFQYFKELKHPEINRDLIVSCCNEIPISVDRASLFSLILCNYKRTAHSFNEQRRNAFF